MITLLIFGGATAAIALLAKYRGAVPAAAPAPAAAMAPIGSATTPTPSTPTAVSHTIFPTPADEALYQTAIQARAASAGIPIQVGQPQTAPAAAPAPTAVRYVLPVAPAPSRAPIAQVYAGGRGVPSRQRFSLL